MSLVLEVIFKALGYSLIFYGLWITAGTYLVKNYFNVWLQKYKRHKQIRRLNYLNSSSKESVNRNSKFYDYLDLRLSSLALGFDISVNAFVSVSVIFSVVTTIMLAVLLGSFLFPLAIGVFVGLVPYFLVLYRVEAVRLKSSYSFINEFHVVLQTYQGTNKNIYYVLLNTVDNLKDSNLKRLFRRLIMAFQKDRTDEDFKRSVMVFMFSVSSTFSQRFGNLIIKAHLDDIDIGESLIDLNNDIVARKNQLDAEKTEKLQTVILGFAPIFILPLTVYFAYRLSGVVDFWYFFMRSETLTLFVIAVILSIVSVLLSLLYRKPKTNL